MATPTWKRPTRRRRIAGEIACLRSLLEVALRRSRIDRRELADLRQRADVLHRQLAALPMKAK